MWIIKSRVAVNMQKSLLLVAVAAAVLIYYKTHAPLKNMVVDAEPQPIAISIIAPTPEPVFRCEGKQHCSQMASCAEARFYLKNCPAVRMDGDGDGIPCETPPLQCTF
ncbi:excalibur calcium-binding domain-containing protein [Cupriavidus necator]|uniref:excalibur calcium-binding domain-containing protein n=1 Tax=Cupriavidus necator TaxID=106590 RepID=UPI001E5F477B|nr:excalibur calcium-binding domain-containing protein [Cupriavidus necator]